VIVKISCANVSLITVHYSDVNDTEMLVARLFTITDIVRQFS